MATSRNDSREDEGKINAGFAASSERTSATMATESEQGGPDDTPRPKPQVSEPCMATMENYLLAHFFFIFAASFILGVIFLHSSLSFWSWQVYDDVPPFTAEQPSEIPEAFPYNQGNDYGYTFKSNNDVLKAVISPNMTISLAR